VKEISDEELMQNIQNGKIADLAVLFDRYQVKLYNFFLKLSFDAEVSADLTQQLFFRLMKYNSSYKPEQGSFKSWFYQMGRNIFLDYSKNRHRSTSITSPVTGMHENIPEIETDYTEEDYQKLDRCLACLPAEQREIIVLSRYQGLKYEQIADIMKISIPAIKVRVHRAIKEMKAIYFKD
jgi:RNA polymerase sigma factor (sigma-70 family)